MGLPCGSQECPVSGYIEPNVLGIAVLRQQPGHQLRAGTSVQSGAGRSDLLAYDVGDETSLVQVDALAQAGVDRSKILAWDTILAMDVNTEKDEVKQMAATLKKQAAVAKAFAAE